MKKALILASMAVLALVSCNKNEFAGTEKLQELSIIPMAGDAATRGYTPGSEFQYAAATNPDATIGYRDMQISAYLYPQDGEQGNYFVNKTYSFTGDGLWHATPDPIYWPVGGTMDFLAFSLSEPKNVSVVWNEANAASEVALSVPGENTQNDILFASAAGVKSTVSGGTVNMVFDHAQAWLQFNLSTTSGDDVITFKRIVLEKVYNAGELDVINNGGNATAAWDFSGAIKQDIAVDDIQGLCGNKLKAVADMSIYRAQQLNMLIPQQQKTAFVIYYTLGNEPQELSYRFDTDLKTWLMGEKYIYNICINTSEITVNPTVSEWKAGEGMDVTLQ